MSQPVGVAPMSMAPVAIPTQAAAQPLDIAQRLAADLRGRWVGEGINTLWVPTSAGTLSPTPPPTYQPVPIEPPKPLPKFVSSRTTETLVVGAPAGSVPNRGPGDEFSEVAAPYEQRVHDENGNLVHTENRFWLATPTTQLPPASASIAKLSSIPHGSVAVVQGALPSRQNGQTQISVSSAAPAVPSGVPGLVQPDGPLAPEFIHNVASYVQQRVATDRTGVLWELQLLSMGVANIAFLKREHA